MRIFLKDKVRSKRSELTTVFFLFFKLGKLKYHCLCERERHDDDGQQQVGGGQRDDEVGAFISLISSHPISSDHISPKLDWTTVSSRQQTQMTK